MTEVRDCVTFGITINLRVGIGLAQGGTADEETTSQWVESINEIKSKYEAMIADEFCELIGWSMDRRLAERKAHDKQMAADRKAEEEGRAEKAKLRLGTS